jgi:esterase/lipase superfamily enzyme
MQKIYPRTNQAPFEVSENSNAKPVTRVEDALREFARQDAAQGPEPEKTTQVVPDVNSLIQRAAGVSLTSLQNVISDLQQLHDFLHNEAERIQREISDYLQLSQTAMGSTKMIADNIVLWKETAHSTAGTREKRNAATEGADFVAPAPPPLRSPTAAKDPFIPMK